MNKLETVSMLELGRVQLQHAILHFEAKEYVPAITLAGAADEILGRLNQGSISKNALSETHRWHVAVAKIFWTAPPTFEVVKKAHTKVRNELKHNDTATNHTIERDFEWEAIKIIDMAVKNWIMYHDYKAPDDPVIGRYHQTAVTWKGGIPNR